MKRHLSANAPRVSSVIHSDRPHAWVSPRAHQDASLRYLKHGPIQPMEQPKRGWLGMFRRVWG